MKDKLESIRKAYLVLVVGLGIFSAVMVFAAWYASNIAPRLMEDNYRSVQYATAMERAFISIYVAESAGKPADTALGQLFEQNLKAALDNITEPGEHDLLKRLETDWNAFRSQPKTPGADEFESILGAIQQCIVLNETRMFNLRDRASTFGLTVTAFGIMGLALALLYAAQYVDWQLKKLAET